MNHHIPKNQEVKKIHHYVWAYYLRNWSNDRKNVWRRTIKNKVEMYSVRGMLYMDNFYKIGELDDDHIKIINYIFSKSDLEQKKLIHNFISINQLFFKYSNSIDEEVLKSHGLDNDILLIMANSLEDQHSRIEMSAKPIINSLANHDLTIIDSNKDMAIFLCFLANQMIRTKPFKEMFLININKHEKFLRDKLAECWWIVSYFMAINLGRNLYATKGSDKHTLLINNTEEPFITSDHPVINVHSALDNGLVTLEENQMDLYYPISPTVAYMIHNSQKFESGKIIISLEAACELNEKMAKNANTHIIGNNKEIIEKYKNLTGYWINTIKK